MRGGLRGKKGVNGGFRGEKMLKGILEGKQGMKGGTKRGQGRRAEGGGLRGSTLCRGWTTTCFLLSLSTFKYFSGIYKLN